MGPVVPEKQHIKTLRLKFLSGRMGIEQTKTLSQVVKKGCVIYTKNCFAAGLKYKPKKGNAYLYNLQCGLLDRALRFPSSDGS